MSEVFHYMSNHQIVQNLDHLILNPGVLQPTLTFIYKFEHRHMLKRIKIFLRYLWIFRKTCPFFSLLTYYMIYRKFDTYLSIESQWTHSDDEHFHLLKVQMCDHIETYINNFQETPALAA